MTENDFGERFDTSHRVERTERDTDGPVESWHPLTDEVPVEAALVHATPMVATVAAVDPMGEPIVHEAPTTEMMRYEAPVNAPVVDGSGLGQAPHIAPMGETIAHAAPIIGANAGPSATLLGRDEAEHFRTRWSVIQGKFVDEPRAAVQQADTLVSEVVQQITRMLANEHSSLGSQWNQGSDVSTEDLRQALQRYRSLFNRLVV
jgi:hypothetical protein